MRLGPCATMNDDFETAVLERHGMLEKLFYACFTKADESLAMYKLYGIDHDSVIFRISYADLEKSKFRFSFSKPFSSRYCWTS